MNLVASGGFWLFGFDAYDGASEHYLLVVVVEMMVKLKWKMH